MRPPFEIWAKQEISRLRSEADALEHAVQRYLGTSNPQGKSLAASGDGRRPSKYDPLIKEWQAAGPAGMTLDDLQKSADAVGLGINRASLRSMLFNFKKKGNAKQTPDGRHVWVGSQEEIEPPNAVALAAQ